MKTKHSLVGLLLVTLFTVSIGHAQVKSTVADTVVQKQELAYQCPMKCEGEKTYDKPGDCPKCGMHLSKIDNTKTSGAEYHCSMKCDGDKKYNKPGNCPKCNMKLEKTKK